MHSFTIVLSCIIHIIFIGIGIFFPYLPEIRVLKKTLKDIEFPLTFFLCAFQIENSTERYKNLGYRNDVFFFLAEACLTVHLLVGEVTPGMEQTLDL